MSSLKLSRSPDQFDFEAREFLEQLSKHRPLKQRETDRLYEITELIEENKREKERIKNLPPLDILE